MVRLIGVNHGSRHSVLGEGKVYPSRELMDELVALPDGTSVGIEYFKELYSDGELKDTDEIPISESTRDYWQTILTICEVKGFTPVFLDDIETCKRVLGYVSEADKKEFELRLLMANKENENVSPEEIELRRAIYENRVEGDSIYIINREEKLLENIVKYKPDVVLLGIGHSDPIINDRAIIESELGITFDDYSKDEFVPGPEPLDYDSFVHVNRFVRSASPNEEGIAERRAFDRKYFALKMGRILPAEKPDYIGTWDLYVPARGLFEVYIINKPDGRVEGVIEDCIGSAQFLGAFSDDELKLVKVYDEMAVKLGGSPEPIHYRGTLQGDSYNGTFKNNEIKGAFRLETPKDIAIIVDSK